MKGTNMKRQNCVSYQTAADEKAINHKIYILLPVWKHMCVCVCVCVCKLFMEGKHVAVEKPLLQLGETDELRNWFLFVVTFIMYQHIPEQYKKHWQNTVKFLIKNRPVTQKYTNSGCHTTRKTNFVQWHIIISV